MSEERLKIATKARRTISFIEKNIYNFPNDYIVIKSKILNSLYEMLEFIYKANLTQAKEDKQMILVKIQMLNYYLKSSLDKDLITDKKFYKYTSHLNELHKMIYVWFINEKSE